MANTARRARMDDIDDSDEAGASTAQFPARGGPSSHSESSRPLIAIDPVCGMAIDRDRSIALEHEGELLFFCSRGCRDEFLGVGPIRDEARAEELVRRVLDEPEALRSVFQPIVALDTGAVVGYEALARFAPVPFQLPEAWFDLAARAGLTPELEGLAVRRALDLVGRRPPPASAFISLNVGPLLLGDDRIASVLAAPPVDAGQLVLELTERDRVADYGALRAAIAPYRARGFRIAVDDAGAGYASMRHVTELRPEFVKLDARLIAGLTGDQARQALVGAMATFVGEIGGAVIAEGVESIADLDVLARSGRGILAQGNAVARPGPAWPTVTVRAMDLLHIGSRGAAGRLPPSQLGSAEPS